MNRHFPFRTLLDKIQYMKTNEAEISNMYSTGGNRRATRLVNDIVQRIFDKEPREKIVKELKAGWKELEKKHPEINETDVRESIFWYFDAACSWVRYEEIGMDEIRRK
jgi:hypothetical protein